MSAVNKIDLIRESVYIASRLVMRDFYEIQNIKNSANASRFLSNSIKKAQQNALSYLVRKRYIIDDLEDSKIKCSFIPVDSTDNFLASIPFFSSIMVTTVNEIIDTIVLYTPLLQKAICYSSNDSENCYVMDNYGKKKQILCRTSSNNFVIICDQSSKIFDSIPNTLIEKKVSKMVINSLGFELSMLLSGRCECVLRTVTAAQYEKNKVIYDAINKLLEVSDGIFSLEKNILLMSNKQISKTIKKECSSIF
ncbi:hypothetical protein GUI12_03775 [Anaplasmataceae bacterium AB001_6]|nr:hypothetical protein GUI12_03775 [Anaplasmataceae bacterium AB001_6]